MRRFLFFFLIFVPMGELPASDLSFVAGLAPTGKAELEEGGHLNFDTFPLLGARFEKDFFFILGFENNLIYGSGVLAPKSGEGEPALYYTANLVLNLPNEKIVPNFVFGLGILHRFGNSTPDVGTSFITNWGLGVKLHELSGPVGLRFDYRRIGIRGVEDSTVTAQEITGGIVISFL